MYNKKPASRTEEGGEEPASLPDSRVGQYTDFLVIPQYHFLISTRILNTEIPYLGIIYSYLCDLLCIYIF